MRKIIIGIFMSLFLITNGYCKTLVKYYRNTGEIIQTNVVDEMPPDEILNDRFRTESTDVILVDEAVDIATQRVDLNKKKIKNISKTELDNKKQITDEEQQEEKLIQDRIRKIAIEQLKSEGQVFKHN